MDEWMERMEMDKKIDKDGWLWMKKELRWMLNEDFVWK